MPELGWDVTLWTLAGWIFLAIIAKPLLEGMKTFVDGVKTVLEHVSSGLDGASAVLGQVMPQVQTNVRGVGDGVAAALAPVAGALGLLLGAMGGHWDRVQAAVTEGATSKHQRFLGAFIYLAAMPAFLYADAALSYNTAITLLTRARVPIPPLPAFLAFLSPLLQDVTLPLMVAFVFNALMLGIILSDLYHHTELARWPKSGGVLAVYRSVAVINGGIVVVLALFFMIGRFAELSQGWITIATLQSLDGLAIFAMNAITVPALVTTFLLWPVVFAFVVLWLVLVGLCIAAFGLARGLVMWLQRVAPLLANFAATLLGWLAGLVRSLLKVLAWSFQLLHKALDIPVRLIEWFVTTATYPLKQLWEWLTGRGRGGTGGAPGGSGVPGGGVGVPP